MYSVEIILFSVEIIRLLYVVIESDLHSVVCLLAK